MQASPPPKAASAAELVAQFEEIESLNDRIGILRQLAIVGKDESVPLIEKLFDHEDPAIRQYALAAAESNPSPAAGTALVKAVAKAEDADWKVAVIDAIGGRREKTAVGPLGGLITDPDDRVAAAAIAALGNIGTMQAALPLWNARKKVAPALGADVVRALMSIRDQIEVRKEPDGLGNIYRGVPHHVDEALTKQSHLRLAGIRGLAKTGDLHKALGFAINELKNGSLREQAEAARILIDLEDEDRVVGPNNPHYRFVDVQKKLFETLPTLPPTAQGFLLEALAEREARLAEKNRKNSSS